MLQKLSFVSPVVKCVQVVPRRHGRSLKVMEFSKTIFQARKSWK